MSCCCAELLDGIRKEEEEEGRRKMDVSLLREEYRSSRERRRRRTQVLLFRTVSEELSEAVSIVPVAQGQTSPWEPNGTTPPAVTFNPEQMICDPWHVHLDLHRRSCPRIITQLPASCPETSRRSCSSSSEAGGSQQESGCRKLSGSLSSFTETSPCCTFITTREEEDPDPASFRGSEMVQALLSPNSSLCTVSEGCSTPITASMVSSPSTSTTNLHQDQEENHSAEKKTSNSVLEGRSSRKFSAPALRLARQLSVGGAASSSQIYYPFPSRRTPRISEAARRLGMYSTF
ncbi:uncharacterized protein LOC115799343 [Archocentrus centrarchus]|uniref:uncharacterized protein LOC115799343 n=1 Tax=Archocentrus centrarchus TaxID=63155 RepID=UPI0011E9B4C0|nr:uncharacterized protein LOC115799343 [Archocentrus centrarchus]